MRIAMIQDEWWPRIGGGPIHVKQLAIALARHHNCEVDIYTRALKEDGETYSDTEHFESGKVTINRVGSARKYWDPLGRFQSLWTPLPGLLKGDYDIVHGHTYLPAIPTRISGALSDSTTVFTVHGTALTISVGRDETILARPKRVAEKVLVQRFNYDSAITVNKKHISLLENHHDDVYFIPNGVDIDRFTSESATSKDVLFVGRLAPAKRVTDLIAGFAKIEDQFPTSKLRIVGDGPKKDTLVEQAISLGIEDQVIFEGSVPRDRIPDILAKAGVFVLPSVREGHPLTLLEAWASGTPVIATEVEGIKEFVDHMESGYLISPKSPDELAEALKFVFNNPIETEKWASMGHDLVVNKYSWEEVAKKTYEVYKRAI